MKSDWMLRNTDRIDLPNPEARYKVGRHEDGLSVSAGTGVSRLAALLYQGAGDAELAADNAMPGPLRLWLGHDPNIDWRHSTFVPIPERLRLSPLNLFFRDLTGGGFAPDPARLIFQALDFDAY